MRVSALLVMALVVAGCGGGVSASKPADGGESDVTIGSGPVEDGGGFVFDASITDAGGFPFPFYDAYAVAFEDCDGGCPGADFCAADHFYGGGKSPQEPVAPAGCHPLPAACATDRTCSCLIAQAPASGPCQGDCIVDDAGTPVMRCLIQRP